MSKPSISTGKIVRYTMLPQFWPRIVALFTSVFSLTAYSIACIFYGVRLLPRTHPYVNPANIGSFGLRHVLFETGKRLQFGWKYADQLVIYTVIVSGVALLLSQFALMGVAVVSHQPVFANVLTDLFVRSQEDQYQDLVMITMDRIFGVPGIFDSCISVASEPCTDRNGVTVEDYGDNFPFPFHYALHDMFEFYSNGIFAIAVFVLLYFVTVLVSETAVSGSPFGQRYNKTWVPVRIILFFALLTPLGDGGDERNKVNGMNMAQFATLWVAKTGSHFASNGWTTFNQNLAEAHLAGAYDLVAVNKVPSFDRLFQSIFIARSCKLGTEFKYGEGQDEDWIKPYLVRADLPFSISEVPEDKTALFLETPYETAIKHSARGPVRIVFGPRIEDENSRYYARASDHHGNVIPICGSLEIPALGNSSTTEELMPGEKVQALYYNLLQTLWNDEDVIDLASCVSARYFEGMQAAYQNKGCPDLPEIRNNLLMNKMQEYRTQVATQYKQVIDEHNANTDAWKLNENLLKKGWAAAALWYNQIAELNGQVSEGIMNLPEIIAYPEVMEYVATEKAKLEENVVLSDVYNPVIQGGKHVDFVKRPYEEPIAYSLYSSFSLFNIENDFATIGESNQNLFMAVIDLIFGAGGLYDFYENPDIHPLAQLSALGKGIMDASIRNIAIGTSGSLLSKRLEGKPEQLVKQLSSVAQQVGFTALTIGFGMYYILPLMPFVYFFFAFGGWVKAVFEAIVAGPLWAMAHIIRWDGDGIAGPATSNAYMLLFEIFLRPILILFGLLASISFFSAMVAVLNDIFAMVIANVGGSGTGYDLENIDAVALARTGLDEFFYTVVYTTLCYMMGLSSFKMIDQIPNEILRWMGDSTKTFQEMNKNAAEQLSGSTYQGMTIASSKLGGMTMGADKYHALGIK